MYVNEKKILENIWGKEKRLVIFGVGRVAERFLMKYMWLHPSIAFFIDNYSDKTTFMEKKVFRFNEIKGKNLDEYLIVVANSHYRDIFHQLSSCGLVEGEHYIQIFEHAIDWSTTMDRVIEGVKVGRFTYGYSKHCYRNSLLKEVGAFTSINESARIGEVNHPLNFISTHPLLYTPKDRILGYEGVPGILNDEEVIDVYSTSSNQRIIIGNDVWIGANTILLPGVTIGDGAVIGAGAVVTKDVLPYAIVGGVPAKVIRYRFSPEEIEVLLRVKWWEWDIEEIKSKANLLKNPTLFFNSVKQ